MMNNWWEKPLDDLNQKEWEDLCDGCGLCCLNKMEDIDTGEVYFSRVACKLLDLCSARCGNYAHRQEIVADCLNLRDIPKTDYRWLPKSCSYRLRHEGKPLPDWHPLIFGNNDAVHRFGRSVSHFALSENDNHAIDDYLLLRLEDILGEK